MISLQKAKVYANQSGWIMSIDSMEIGLVGVLVGAGRKTVEESVDFSAGVEFHARIGMEIKEGDHLATVYTERAEVLKSAVQRVHAAFAFSVFKPKSCAMITHFITKDSVEKFNLSACGKIPLQ